MQPTQQQIKEILSKVIYPQFSENIISYGFVKNISIDEKGSPTITLHIPSRDELVAKALRDNIERKLDEAGIKSSQIHINTPVTKVDSASQNPQAPQNFSQNPHNSKNPQSMQNPQNSQNPLQKNLLPQAKSFVMVSSGKGGVGKSTVATNLAIALAMQGQKVGLLDVDIYGPNIPRMFGVSDKKPDLDESGKKLIPINAYGVDIMSIGLLFSQGESLIWRGPILMRAIAQLFSDVAWGEMDIMVLDMPPGTGDAQLSIAQSVPVSVGIAVSTPQLVSLDDGARCLDMFAKLSIPTLGIIENMSGYICPCCGEKSDIFSANGTEKLAQKYNTKVLSKIPIDNAIGKGGDEGKPVVYFSPDSSVAKAYMQCAIEVVDFLGQK
ncbi:Mrp/NBP35 family ATP-binding protein [Helicobacter sp. T3_23-1059]